MAGPNPAKHELEGATGFVQVEDEGSGAAVTHLGVEDIDLNGIVEAGENSYVGGTDGGAVVGAEGGDDRAGPGVRPRSSKSPWDMWYGLGR